VARGGYRPERGHYQPEYSLASGNTADYFPPGLIIAIPVFGNLLINLVKMTSLVNIIGIVDVFGAQKISQNSYGAKQVAAFISVIIVYWVLNSIILYFTTRIEKKYQFLLE
jgi:L-cystine transport system permease protein